MALPHTVPTVKVVSPSAPGGFIVINESDLTAEHEIWTERPVRPIDETLQGTPIGRPRNAVAASLLNSTAKGR